MNRQKYEVILTAEERQQLQDLLYKEDAPEKAIKRARVLMALDCRARGISEASEEPTLRHLAEKCGVSTTTILKISKQFAEQGLTDTLKRKKRATPPKKPIINGEVEERIMQLTRSEPPAGYSRWTLHLLELKIVELGIVPQISDSTLSRMFKKRRLNLSSPDD